MVSIINGERPSRPPHTGLTDELWELTQHCWDGDQRKRPHMWEVLEVLNLISCPTHRDTPPQLEESNNPTTDYQPPPPETPGELLPAATDGLAPPSVVQHSPEFEPSGKAPKHFAETYYLCLEPSDDEVYHPCPEEYNPLTREADLPIEECQLLEKLFGHEILKSHAHCLSGKIWQGFIDSLDEVGRSNTQPYQY